MGSKGVSPLIAAVMLLAFAMAIGGMFSEWSGEMFRDTTSDTTDNQKEILDCSGKTIEVAKVETSSKWLNVTLRADGGKLGKVEVYARPSQQVDTIYLNRDGGINTSSIYIPSGNQQDSFRAAATSCRITISEEVEY